jgi:hypothetical protein
MYKILIIIHVFVDTVDTMHVEIHTYDNPTKAMAMNVVHDAIRIAIPQHKDRNITIYKVEKCI